jgi:ubiquinone/menaquinone biosynthesis C-methylase UbiE
MEIDAAQYDRIARTVFAPVYPLIADQIIARTGVTRGVCLDIGCGGGHLGTALGRFTQLFVYFFDASPEMLAIANRTIMENGLGSRAGLLQGDVAAIPLPEASVDLAVSRGSIFFWEALAPAFAEIHRVLAPGGWAYVGGGFGTRELQAAIVEQMAARNQGNHQFRDRVGHNLGTETRARFETELRRAGIATYTIIQGDGLGLWVVMRK